jgi:hypothetical protein
MKSEEAKYERFYLQVSQSLEIKMHLDRIQSAQLQIADLETLFNNCLSTTYRTDIAVEVYEYAQPQDSIASCCDAPLSHSPFLSCCNLHDLA